MLLLFQFFHSVAMDAMATNVSMAAELNCLVNYFKTFKSVYCQMMNIFGKQLCNKQDNV